MMIAIIGVVILVIGFLLFLAFGSGSSNTQRASEIYLRLETLETLAKDQQKLLRSNALRTHNGTLLIFLTNAKTDIESLSETYDFNPKKIPKNLEEKEKTYVTDLETTFEDAHLNVVLDRTYARQMSYELTTLQAQLASLYKHTRSQSARDKLAQIDENISPTIETFSKFAATK